MGQFLKKNREFPWLGTLFLLAILCCGVAISDRALAQEEEKSKPAEEGAEPAGEEEDFTNYGLISISNKFELSKDRRHIAFNILNNTGRSISNLFGWVYEFDEDESGKKNKFILRNYPHKGSVCISSRFHKPGKRGKWRFVLKRAVPDDAEHNFLLMVNLNSIFFAKVEPIEPKEIVSLEEGAEEGEAVTSEEKETKEEKNPE